MGVVCVSGELGVVCVSSEREEMDVVRGKRRSMVEHVCVCVLCLFVAGHLQ